MNDTSGDAFAGPFGSDAHRFADRVRNPLTAIGGFAELILMDPGLSASSAGYARAILAGSDALTEALITDGDRVGRAAPASVPAASAIRRSRGRATAGRRATSTGRLDQAARR